MTNNLARTLSNLNYQRVSKNGLSKIESKYVFICLTGLPPFEKEMDNLDLPGEKIILHTAGFEPGITNSEIINRAPEFDLEIQANQIETIFRKQTKQVVFVYHSFGTFSLSVYFTKYGTNNVAGLIELGPAPIRMYKLVRNLIQMLKKTSKVQLRTDMRYY